MATSPINKRTTQPTSPTPASATSSRAADTSKVARSHLPGANSPGASKEDAPAYNFNSNLHAAYRLLQENKPEEARGLFQKIQTQLSSTGTKVRGDSLCPIHCSLGLAFTYPEGTEERSKHAVEAYQAINLVWAYKKSWNDLTPEIKSKAYCALRHCLKRFQPLIPHDQDLVRREMVEKIAECSKHILPLENFNEKLQEAAKHIQKNEVKEACALFTEALQLIEGKTEPCYLSPRVNCLLSFAQICDEADKNELSQRAKTAVFQLYDAKASINTADDSKRINFINLLQDFLKELCKLFPDTSSVDYLEIQARIEACQKDLPADGASSQPPPKVDEHKGKDSLTAPPAPSPSETTHGGIPPKKITPGPVGGGGSWRIGRIFAVLALAALAVASFVFYRRNIVKIN